MADPPNRRLPQPGEPAPWFTAPLVGEARDFTFASIGGRVCLMLFHGSSHNPAVARALDTVKRRRAVFDDIEACFFGVTVDPAEVAEPRLAVSLPGLRHFLDADLAVSKLYGAVRDEAAGGIAYQPHFLLLDRQLRIMRRFALSDADAALDAAAAAAAEPSQDWAPVLNVPRVLEPELCRALIAVYDGAGGQPSGFMRDIAGKTTLVVDPAFKRRSDHDIVDAGLRTAIMHRLHDRLAPAIKRTFQFHATRVERYIVACYDAADQGHFRAHRDNTTRGTAHRRFAVTINLNDDYDGGDLRFPEFGARTYRAPVGGAVVFSCSLLHEATPVTRGRRYACLPFLYDEAAAKVRAENVRYLDGAAA